LWFFVIALALLNVDVDREMCVDITHLVLVAPSHTSDQVLDNSLDGTEGSNILSDTMVELNGDGVGRTRNEGNRKMLEVLYELSTRSGDGDEPRLDSDGDCEIRNPISTLL